ncbi:MAG TPA: hypothetical protein PLV42_07140 [bacterium]|nr:hypothetical protein [bacterium]
MKSAQLVVLVVCVLLVSCATMRNPHLPDHGSCIQTYLDAEYGEKEAFAGAIMLPVGGALVVLGPFVIISGYAYVMAKQDPMPSLVIGSIITGLGGLGVIAGVATLIDGNLRVNKWNDYCAGSTAAERYCLFEPLPPPNGETP